MNCVGLFMVMIWVIWFFIVEMDVVFVGLNVVVVVFRFC